MNKARRYCRILAIALMLTSGLAAVASPAITADTTFYKNYSYIRFVGGSDTIDISDEEFYDISAKVVFAVNAYQLKEDDSLLRELADEVLPQVNKDSLELAYMIIRGAASPEGPYLYNKQLGQKRAQSLIDFLKAHITIPVDPDHFNLDIEAEDYRTLCIMMQRAGDKDYSLVKSIYDKHIPQNGVGPLKTELQTVQGGALWKRLLRDYYPGLRVARVVLFFRKARPVAAKQTVQTVPVVPVVPVLVEREPATAEPETLRLPRRELLAVKTNLLMDFAYMPGYNRWCPLPNVAVEYYPLYGHFTYGLSIDFPWWRHYDDHKFFQVRNYQAEVRYYRHSGSIDRGEMPGTKAAFSGLYFQAYAHAGLYGICFDADRGWEGEGVGGGLGIGYVMPLTKNGHWRMEFGAQVGFFTTKYDPYQFENPIDPSYKDNLYYYKWTLAPDLFKRRQYRYNWLGPTRVGITLSYDLLYRRINKRGISFYSTETQVVQPAQTRKEDRP
ncbi:MAG: DUF3575 domain-containing protein [Prevotella sp.]|nr:DUF3575 domain-containing protein [Prevotella sp.]